MFLKKLHDRSVREIAQQIVHRADAARDAGNFHHAALLYEEALYLQPNEAGLHVQCANMLKDSGKHSPAEQHYETALALRPDDADAWHQLGHLYKSWGRLDRAEAAYRRASELLPDWGDPKEELERLKRAGLIDEQAPSTFTPESELAAAAAGLTTSSDIERLAPELAPRPPQTLRHPHREEISLRALGRLERSFWGIVATLRGIEAVRGFCISATPITEIQFYLNDQLIYRAAPKPGSALIYESDNPDLRKYAFNFWLDFGGLARGRHRFEVRGLDARGRSQNHSTEVVISEPLAEEDFPSSDQLVSVDPSDRRSIDEQIDARPSVIRPGRRALLATAPRTILVQRLDQLGDMVVSVPALRLLRDMFPEARLVGLLSPANADLGATLGLFDEIVVADFPDDRLQRRRIMPIGEQIALRERLSAFNFDLAIDLSENSPSRLLLALSGAPFRFGFRHPMVPNLPLDLEGNTHDRMNGHEVAPHSNKLVGMMEWLRAMMRSEPNVARREDLDWTGLAPFGLSKGDRFAVIHDGARLAYSRWPYYPEFARLILAQTDLKVILLTDDKTMREALLSELPASDRFQLVDGRLAFDQFDALVSFCTIFVGNDSGPKHLASLRGAPVVSIHMARNNWNEWGQENGGYILSRKLPCAGCQISYDADECGRDFVCIRNIKPEEVMQAVRRLL